jgi:hypothetical protein
MEWVGYLMLGLLFGGMLLVMLWDDWKSALITTVVIGAIILYLWVAQQFLTGTWG